MKLEKTSWPNKRKRLLRISKILTKKETQLFSKRKIRRILWKDMKINLRNRWISISKVPRKKEMLRNKKEKKLINSWHSLTSNKSLTHITNNCSICLNSMRPKIHIRTSYHMIQSGWWAHSITRNLSDSVINRISLLILLLLMIWSISTRPWWEKRKTTITFKTTKMNKESNQVSLTMSHSRKLLLESLWDHKKNLVVAMKISFRPSLKPIN